MTTHEPVFNDVVWLYTGVVNGGLGLQVVHKRYNCGWHVRTYDVTEIAMSNDTPKPAAISQRVLWHDIVHAFNCCSVSLHGSQFVQLWAVFSEVTLSRRSAACSLHRHRPQSATRHHICQLVASMTNWPSDRDVFGVFRYSWRLARAAQQPNSLFNWPITYCVLYSNATRTTWMQTYVNCGRPVWWEFFPLELVVFQLQEKHTLCTKWALHTGCLIHRCGVEWQCDSAQRLDLLVWSRVGHRSFTICLGRRLKTEWHPEPEGCLNCMAFRNSFSQQGRLRGPWPFQEHKQSFRCCNLLSPWRSNWQKEQDRS